MSTVVGVFKKYLRMIWTKNEQIVDQTKASFSHAKLKRGLAPVNRKVGGDTMYYAYSTVLAVTTKYLTILRTKNPVSWACPVLHPDTPYAPSFIHSSSNLQVLHTDNKAPSALPTTYNCLPAISFCQQIPSRKVTKMCSPRFHPALLWQ